MVHLVYCDDKSKELSKILDGSKTMIIRESCICTHRHTHSHTHTQTCIHTRWL